MTGGGSDGRARITVVTPSLNQAAFIEECILSVRDQLGPGDEHIVVDGASTDGTVEIVQKFPHLRWVSEPDRGQADALNKGFRMATGDIIGWLNADDAYVKETLEIVRRFFRRHPEVALGYGYVYVIDSESRRVRKRLSPDFDFGLLVRSGDCYAQPTFFFRKSALEEVGYLDPAQRWTMDYDMILRFGRRFPVKKIPRCLGSFRVHPGSMSHSGADDPRMRQTAREIQARFLALAGSRYPAFVYRIRDRTILTWFKVLGRVASLPMYLRYRLSTLGRREERCGSS